MNVQNKTAACIHDLLGFVVLDLLSSTVLLAQLMFLLTLYLHGEVEFLATGLWNLLSTNQGVGHRPD